MLSLKKQYASLFIFYIAYKPSYSLKWKTNMASLPIYTKHRYWKLGVSTYFAQANSTLFNVQCILMELWELLTLTNTRLCCFIQIGMLEYGLQNSAEVLLIGMLYFTSSTRGFLQSQFTYVSISTKLSCRFSLKVPNNNCPYIRHSFVGFKSVIRLSISPVKDTRVYRYNKRNRFTFFLRILRITYLP